MSQRSSNRSSSRRSPVISEGELEISQRLDSVSASDDGNDGTGEQRVNANGDDNEANFENEVLIHDGDLNDSNSVDAESGEDLFGDDMERDYEPHPELDVLSQAGLDDCSQNSVISLDARRAAEREMDERDGIYDSMKLLYSDDDEHRKSERLKYAKFDDECMDRGDFIAPVDILENLRGRTIRDHVKDGVVSSEIQRRFKDFLRTFKDPVTGNAKYMDAIKQMAAENRESIVVDYDDLAHEKGEQNICYFLPEAPVQMLDYLSSATTRIVLSVFPHYSRIAAEVKVRLRGMPVIDEIRMLRQVHLNMLIRTVGVVTLATGMLPRLSLIKFDCSSCGGVIGPFVQRENEEVKPTSCPICNTRGPFELNMEQTLYHNYQRIIVQESPNKVGAGRLPRSKDVILTGDLCGSCKPGDEIDLTGVYTISYDSSVNSRNGFPVFNTLICANYIASTDTVTTDCLTDEDIKVWATDIIFQSIKNLSRDRNISQRIFYSIAPSIYGHQNVKRAIALSLFRGEQKNPGEKHNIRGDINVLLCGDPGTAKSQILRYAAHTAPRAVLTTGQGASAVGLTAYVKRHPVSQEWTLEAGAMVLADQGVCLIDEFDKMNDQDRTSIHEAMEQQTISISKAGIVTSLHARCTVIAAANPISGRYDVTRTFAENVNLTEPILSRFDVLCVIRDVVDPCEDERLAEYVVASHDKHHPCNTQEEQQLKDQHLNTLQSQESQEGNEMKDRIIQQDLLRKYIMYARENIHPKLQKLPQEKISKLFADMRHQSLITGSVPVTVRHVESIIRLAEAHAKMHLRHVVNETDVDVSIQVVLESFISTQKASVVRQMRKNFNRYLSVNRDYNELLLFILKEIARSQLHYERARRYSVEQSQITTIEIPEYRFLDKARHYQIENVKGFYKTELFKSNNFSYDEKKKCINQTFSSCDA